MLSILGSFLGLVFQPYSQLLTVVRTSSCRRHPPAAAGGQIFLELGAEDAGETSISTDAMLPGPSSTTEGPP